MECHYDILEVPRTATTDEIKKSYRKLVLQWHPDKNLANGEECKKHFQLIQQAYEVLSDPQERAWYDRHREEIIQGGANYKDETFDIFQFFNVSCFSGYNDSEKGFYTIYRDVFDRIAEEERGFLDEDGEEDFPSFGSSTDPYKEKVHLFYGYWQSFCTCKSYLWLSKYDIKEAPNRKVLRLMEKENKKIREAARKKRNEEIRELVSFIRKRDKRVLAHKKELEEKSAENAKKLLEHKRKIIQERQESLANYDAPDWMSTKDLEDNLKALESHLDSQFNEELSQDEGSEEGGEVDESLYCIACDKLFQSLKAKFNHDNSRKHQDNLAFLKAVMAEEEALVRKGTECGDSEDLEKGLGEIQESPAGEESPVEVEAIQDVHRSKNKKKKKRRKNLLPDPSEEEESPNPVSREDKKEERPSDQKRTEKEKRSTTMQLPPPPPPVVLLPCQSDSEGEFLLTSSYRVEESPDEEMTEEKRRTKKKEKRKNKKEKTMTIERTEKTESQTEPPEVVIISCDSCQMTFPTRNQLFGHLKTTGHATLKEPLPSAKTRRKIDRRK